ncbi:MAG: threonylcarbamoyl-AMP synthase [Bdellovibrionaceae bacterium]|jgi:L-threonylcarbamoyladenylate synthase|nr:threonylcarbamoyl-AMP synthase [Pseudobdellovibrionaceae bacterium]
MTDQEKAIKQIYSGGLLAYPTETLWGLGCDALNEQSVNRLRGLKNKKNLSPLSILVKDIHMATEYAEVPSGIKTLLSLVWPGPVTVILKATALVPEWIHTETGYVGMRCSSHDFVQSVMRKIEVPLVTTSANYSGDGNCKSYEDLDWLPESVLKLSNDLMDPNLYESPKGSLILKISGKNIQILREGVLSADQVKPMCTDLGFSIS